jgi:hypothetical protein
LKNRQKLKLRNAHVTPINIQEVQASSLGMPIIGKNQVTFQYAIFLLLQHYVFFLERQLFLVLSFV